MAVKPIKVLSNAHEVVNLIATHGPMPPAEISKHTGIPRSSVYRLVESLEAIGLLDPLPDTRTRLSLRWLHLADKAAAAITEWSGAHPLIHKLGNNTGQTVYLSVPGATEVTCIDWVQGRGIEILVLKPGGSIPLHSGAAGRVALAFSPQKQLADYLAKAPFEKTTAKSLSTAVELQKDIEITKKAGYAYSEEDVTIGVSALGTPLFDKTGNLVATLSIAGLAQEFAVRKDELLKELFHTTNSLHQQVTGYR